VLIGKRGVSHSLHLTLKRGGSRKNKPILGFSLQGVVLIKKAWSSYCQKTTVVWKIQEWGRLFSYLEVRGKREKEEERGR